MDSGANISIYKLDAEPYLVNARKSNIVVDGFAGDGVAASTDGTLHMYVFDPDRPADGKHVPVPGTTMKGDSNANLLSVWHMVKRLGFTCTMSPDGTNEGFTRREADGSVTRLPAQADHRRRLWIIHYTISHSAEQSKQHAIRRHSALMCRDLSGDCDSRTDDFVDLCSEGLLMDATAFIGLINGHHDAGDGVLRPDGTTCIDDTMNDINVNADALMGAGDVLPDNGGNNTASKTGDMIEVEDDAAYKDAEPVITPSQRPHDRKLQQAVRHWKMGHHGPCPGGCDVCKQTSGTLRRVFKTPTPTFDLEPGGTFGMDSIYWDVESRWGNKYTVCMRDEKTLFPCGFHLAQRSDAITEFVKFIKRMRSDPELRCPWFCKRIRIDNAGEWGADYGEWITACNELGIERLQPPSKSDHRMQSLAEGAVFMTKLHTQRVLLGQRLEWDWWEEAVNYVWFIRQHTVTSRVASPKGRGPAPITELSSNNVDDYECDRRKDYAWPPGTLALVHNPGKHGGAKDVTHARYGQAVRMEKDVVVFESLRDKTTRFRSKNFSVIHLHEGISALQWAGLEPRKLPKACMPEVELSKFVTLVELSKLYTANRGRLPIMKGSSKQGDAPLPSVCTIEKGTGRIWEEDEKHILRPTDGHVDIVPPGLSSEVTETRRIERSVNRLIADPDSYIGCEAHRLFKEYGGIYRGEVLSYDNESKYWKVKYECDNSVDEYDTDDMESYIIRCIDGKSPADGGKAQWIAHNRAKEGLAAPAPEPEPEPEQPMPTVEGFNGKWYLTANRDTFSDVCEAVGISTNQQRLYFDWLIDNFGIGNVKATCNRLYFPNPVGKTKNVTKFNAGEYFPWPEGQLWDDHVRRLERDSDGDVVSSAASNVMSRNAECWVSNEFARAMSKAYAATKRQHEDEDWEIGIDMLDSYVEHERSAEANGFSAVCWAAVETRVREHLNEKGIPTAPKSMKELEKWDDAQRVIWDEAIDKEWDGLNDRNCFKHDLTKEQLQKQGFDPRRIVGMRMLLESKVVNGKFNKAKARNVAQGHKGNLQKGKDYTTVFAAAPDLAVGRLIQALCVILNYVRISCDILQAYLIGKAEEDQQYPVRYPEGRIRDAHRDPTTGEERYALLVGNLYGMPTASRVFSKERDRLLLEELPRRHKDITITRMMYDACLFKVTRKGTGWVSIHVDDADSCWEYAEDGQWWIEATNDLFKTEKQPGVKVVDPEHMLGITRKLTVNDGVRTVKNDQIAYIEEMWDDYGKHRERKRVPTTPMPTQGDNLPPMLDENEKPIGVTDKEAREVHEAGYRQLIGGLLWPARNTSPATAAGVGMLSKCVHRPSWGAWYSALHLLHFMYANRKLGITFSSNGNLEPACYYDSGFNQDLIGFRPLYGFVIYFAGGPLIWRSKKHTTIPMSSSEAEYMTITHAWRHVKWLRSLLHEMGFTDWVGKPTRMIGDNQNATDWSRELMMTDGNRAVDICYMKIREVVAKGEILPEWIKGTYNPSDLLTKNVKKDVIDKLLRKLTGDELIDGVTKIKRRNAAL